MRMPPGGAHVPRISGCNGASTHRSLEDRHIFLLPEHVGSGLDDCRLSLSCHHIVEESCVSLCLFDSGGFLCVC